MKPIVQISLDIVEMVMRMEDEFDISIPEEEAQKIAKEIEGHPGYRKHLELENGDGDDEEMRYSAVVRSGTEQEQTSGK